MKKIYIILVVFFLIFVVFYNFERKKFDFNIIKKNVSFNQQTRIDYFSSIAGDFLPKQISQRGVGSINRKEVNIKKTFIMFFRQNLQKSFLFLMFQLILFYLLE